MKSILFPLLLFCSGVVFCTSPEIPEQLAPEVREYFRKDPQLFRGNPRLFDDVLLTVGRATYNPEKREESRIRARANARAELEKFLKGFQVEKQDSSGKGMLLRDNSLRISKYSTEEIRTRMRGRQKNVEFFGEWLSDNGKIINIAAGIVYGSLPEVEEKVALKNFQCEKPWDYAVLVSRGLHAGGVLLTADEQNHLFLLVSAGAKRSIPPGTRDTLIRGRALALASAFINGKELEENTIFVQRILQAESSNQETVQITFDFKRLQKEKTECLARISKIGSWTSGDQQEEFQVFLLKLSEIWE